MTLLAQPADPRVQERAAQMKKVVERANAKGLAFDVPSGYVEVAPKSVPRDLEEQAKKTYSLGGRMLVPSGHPGGHVFKTAKSLRYAKASPK